MSNIKILVIYFTLPILSLIFLVVNEVSEVGGHGGICTEGSWCFIWAPALLFLTSIISAFIGIIKIFINNRSAKGQISILVIIVILVAIALIIDRILALPGI